MMKPSEEKSIMNPKPAVRPLHRITKKEASAKRPKIAIHLILILASLSMLIPFIWMILTAFKSTAESISVSPFVIFPTIWRTGAFIKVTSTINFLRLYANTILFILLRILCATITSSMAGYALGRIRFRGRGAAFLIVLLQMMVPGQIFVIPQYQMISALSMNNTMFALVFPGLVSSFGAFFMRQAYLALPADLEEAARLDGCNTGQIFLHVLAPLTKSALTALGIFTAVIAYKELMWPMIVNTRKDAMVLSSALANLQGQFTTNYPELMAASLIASLPMIILYLFFQKQFIQSIATSGGKL